MRILGRQFVIGRNIDETLSRARNAENGYRHSYDMLGDRQKPAATRAIRIITATPSTPSGVRPPDARR